jgi:hypothetical protein
MRSCVEAAAELYDRWNAQGVAALSGEVDPQVELVCDPLRPDEPLRGLEGWHEWAARWDRSYDHLHIATDALVPLDVNIVLAFVTITATPAGTSEERSWAAAHVWTFTEGRISGWQVHLDLDAARATLDA